MEMFLVGGAVRDEILGLPTKDFDFTVVLSEQDRWIQDSAFYSDPFMVMILHLERMGFEIFVESRQFLTVRARFPRRHQHRGMVADFVLARQEADYSDGRRPNRVIPGTLVDDLARRDFTMNAIAKGEDGVLIDPFGGQADISARLIRAVGDPRQRIIGEDALRGLRALRFSVTKDFSIDQGVASVLLSDRFRSALDNVSHERKREELDKMFKVDTIRSLQLLDSLDLAPVLFNESTGIRLMPTMKG